MTPHRFLLIVWFSLYSAVLFGQACPTLVGPSASAGPFCIGDDVTLTMTGGTNLVPGTQTVDWYSNTTPGFSPPASGTYVGSATISGTSAAPCSTPPIVLGAIVNPCTDPNNTGPNPGSEENEAFFIWSGGGFDMANFGAQVNNNINAGNQDYIGTLGSCAISDNPTVPVSGSCVVAGTSSTVVPPNVFVFVFTSSLASLPLNVASLCAVAPVYVFQSECSRGTVGNVTGALTNATGGPYSVVFGCPGPFQTLSYSGVGGNNSSIAGWAIGPIGVPAPCGGAPSAIPSPPFAPTNVTIDPLDYTITPADCPGPLYFRAVVSPTPAGCSPSPSSVVSVNLNCPTATISGSETVCEGSTSNAVTINFTGTGPYTFEYAINGVAQGPITTSSNPYTIAHTQSIVGTSTFTLVSVSASSCTGSTSGSATVTGIASSTAMPQNTTACTSNQPIDLTALQDPAAPGGTWSGTFVNGNLFDAGTGASGSFTVTYTPPAGSSCITPGNATITLTAASPTPLANPPSLCGPATYDLNNLLLANTPTGTWSGPNITPPSTFTIPPIGGSGATFTFVYTPTSGCFTPGTVNIFVGPGSNANPLDATICESDQPFDLTVLEDPAFPGGTWSGVGVSGSIFNAGPGAGSYTVTYTPPATAGCVTSGNSQLTVQPASPVGVASGANICAGDIFDLTSLFTSSNPPAGNWSGSFVTGTSFEPPTGATGSFILTFTPTTGATCLLPASTTLVVDPPQQVNLGSQSFCESDGPFNLSALEDPASPSGTWSGTGVSGNIFSPLSAGVGTFTLTFTPDPGLCFDLNTTTVTVSASTAVSLNDASVCEGGGLLDLTPLIVGGPIAGSWSGVGVSGSFFDPTGFVPGSYLVVFTPTSCASPGSATITVTPGGSASLSSASVCELEMSFDLTALQDPAFPTGTWSGPGVSGTIFNASAAGVGASTLTFTPSGGICFTPSSTTIVVDPAISISLQNANLCDGDNPINLNSLFNPPVVSGNWSGSGVVGNTFDPALSGIGNITLTFTPDASICADVATTTIIVQAGSTVSLSSSSICPNSGLFDLQSLFISSPVPGSWSGTGVVGSSFDPSGLPAGNYPITFTPSSTCGGTALATITIQSGATPTLSQGTACQGGGNLDLTTLQDPAFGSGTWSGPGVNGTVFDPNSVAVGSVNLTFTPAGGACNNPATTTVLVATAIPLFPLDGSACVSESTFDLTPLEDPAQPGGNWTGPGVVGFTINPSALGVGTYIYTYSANVPCRLDGQAVVTIVPLTTPQLSGTSVCPDSGPFDLTALFNGSPVAGAWSGTNVSGTTFNTAGLSPGAYPVTFTPSASCASLVTVTITVQAGATPNLQQGSACQGGGLFDLTTLQDPSFGAGTWSGPGVAGTSFDPDAVPVGTVNLTFTPSGGTCNGSATTSMVVSESNGMPVLGTADICVSAGLYDLTQLQDPAFASGSWSGPGVVGRNTLDASGLPLGPLTLTFTPQGACISAATTQVQLVEATSYNINPQFICQGSGIFNLTNLEPGPAAGGTWSGPMVTAATFDPAVVGNFSLTYTPPATSCAGMVTVEIIVSSQFQPNLVQGTTLCSTDPLFVLDNLLDPSLPAGNWSGFGVTGNTFDPSLGAPGTRTLFFDPTDPCGLTASVTLTVIGSGEPSLTDDVACELESSVDLSALQDPRYPTGTWSGPGVAGPTFNPASVGPSNYLLTFTPSAQCATPGTLTMTVNAAQQTTARDTQLCNDQGSFSLTSLLNDRTIAGRWSGTSVAGSTLNLATAPIGVLTVTFTPNVATCQLPVSIQITVEAAGSPSLVDQQLCVSSPALNLTTLVPSQYQGGIWSGTGVSGTSFDPAVAGPGMTNLTYQPPGNCAVLSSVTIEVVQAVSLSLPALEFCIDEGLIDLSTFDPPAAPGGTWTGPGISGNELDVMLAGTGNSTVTYTPPANSCASGSVSGQLAISPLLTVGLLVDTVCSGSAPLDLSTVLDPSFATGTWSGSSVTSNGVFNPTNYDGVDPVIFTPSGGCYTASQFTFNVVGVSPLSAQLPSFTCSPDGQTYTAQVDLDFAGNNGIITTDLGSITGTLLVVSGLLSGTAAIASLSDAASCTPDVTIDLNHVCASSSVCVTSAGTMNGGPFELCSDERLAPNATTGFVDDGNDTVLYVLDNDQDPTNGFLDSGPSSDFGLPPGNGGVQLFVYAYAGDDDGNGGIVASDTCATVSNALRVRWSSDIQVNASPAVCNASNDAYTITFTITGGLAPFTATGGPGGTFSNNGRTYTTNPVASGASFSLGFTSVNGCVVDPEVYNHTCSTTNCTPPNPGTFTGQGVSVCTPYTTDAGYNFDSDTGPGLIQVFVIYSDAAGTNELGRVDALPFDASLFATGGETIYVASLVGEDDGTGGVGNTCFALSALQEIILLPSVRILIDTTVCPGGFLEVGGIRFDNVNPTGTVTLPGSMGECDSLVTVVVSTSSGNDTIRNFNQYCFNEIVEIGGRTFSVNNPSDTFQTGSIQCPNTYYVDLEFLPESTRTITDTLCNGEILVIGGTTYSNTRTSGMETLIATNGCDSIVTINLTFIERIRVELSGDPQFCNPDEISVNLTVIGDRAVSGDIFIDGRPINSVTLQPGTTQLTYPSPDDFAFVIRNMLAEGDGCTAPNVPTLAYQPRISRLEAEISEPLTGFVACGPNPVDFISVQPGQGVAPYQYLWSTGDTSNQIQQVPIGSYSVIITDSYGCQSSAEVTVSEVDTIAYISNVIDPVCDEGTGSISISLDNLPPGLQYRFDIGGLERATQADFVFDNLEEGSYVFQLIQDNGCEQFELFDLVDPPTLNLLKRDTFEIKLGDSVRLKADPESGYQNFQWTPGLHLACDTCPTTMASPPVDWMYSASVLTAEGCTVTDQVFIRVLPGGDIFVPTAFSPNDDGVNDLLVLEAGPEVEIVNSFMVFDRWGELVWEFRNFQPGDRISGWDGRVQGKTLNPGVFVAVSEVLFRDGVVKTFTTDVTLIR